MDLLMPGMDGVTAIAAITQRYPEMEVVAMTSFAQTDLVHGALQAGAAGYLLKDAADDLVARLLNLAMCFRSGFTASTEVPPPDLRWLDFVYELGEIAARGGDIRECLFGTGSAASEPIQRAVLDGYHPDWMMPLAHPAARVPAGRQASRSRA